MPFGVTSNTGRTVADGYQPKPAAAPAPAAPPPIGASGALAQDPAYLAFLRASGLTEQIALGDAARRRDSINQALGIAVDDLDAGGEQSRRGISDSQEDRGVFRSGQTLRRLGEQEEDQARRRSAIELAGAGQLGDIESNLLTQVAGLQTRGAEFGLNQAGNRTYEDGLAALAATPISVPVSTDTTLRRKGY